MKNIFKTLAVVFVALFVNAVGFAQEPVPAVAEKEFKVNFTEQASIFSLTNDTITEVTTILDFNLLDKLDASVSLPLYNTTTGTGIGDVDVALTYKNALTIFNDISVDFIGGIKVPLSGEYSSDEFAYFGGASFGVTKDKVDISQSVKYYLVDNYTYMPYLGGFVDSNVFEGNTAIKYNASTDFSVSANVNSYWSDGQKSILVGPSIQYEASSNITLNAGVGFSVVDDLQFDSLDSVITFGLGFKF
jgi:hypothetical protein